MKVKLCWSGDAFGTIEFETDETDPDKIVEEFYTQGIPGLCWQCSGYRQGHSLEIGDELNEERDEEGRPVIYVETADGKSERYEPWKDEK